MLQKYYLKYYVEFIEEKQVYGESLLSGSWILMIIDL